MHMFGGMMELPALLWRWHVGRCCQVDVALVQVHFNWRSTCTSASYILQSISK